MQRPVGCRAVLTNLLLICRLVIACCQAEGPLNLERRPLEISLRQVLVPALAKSNDQSDLQDDHIPWANSYNSINNRGIDHSSLKRTSFGLRTGAAILDGRDILRSSRRRVDEGQERTETIVWSQPDPRKHYSPPISMIKVYKNDQLFKQPSNERAKKLKIGETLNKRSSSATQIGQDSSQQQQQQLIEAPANGLSTASGEQEQSAESSRSSSSKGNSITSAGSKRKQSSESANNMVTLIKYVPVLLSVPADSVIPLSAATSGASNSNPSAARHKVSLEGLTTQTPAYFGLYKSRPANPIKLIKYQTSAEPPYKLNEGPDENEPESDQYQPAILIENLASAPATSEMVNMIPTAASNAKLAYLPGPTIVAPNSFVYPAGGGGVGGVGASTSKALSAYASRLMSMLRPSSLLSSINTNQAPGGGQQQPILASQPPPPPLVYLLAPAEGFSGTHLRVQQPLIATSAAHDSMMNQASRLQHSTAALASAGHLKGPHTWTHQQANGLICVHNAAQHPEQQSISSKTSALNQPVSASPFDSPLTTTTSSLSQQLIDSNQLHEQSFEYAYRPLTSSTESPFAGTKQVAKKKQPGGRGKDSPAKLAQKLNKSKLAKATRAHRTDSANSDTWPQQQQQQVEEGDEESAAGSHHKLSGSSSERRNTLESSSKATLNSSQVVAFNRSETEAEWQPPRASRRYGNGTLSSAPFIPFTIQDKIDLPASGRWPASARGQVAPGAIRLAPSTTNNPVMFDEPADGEVELRDSGAASDRKRHLWPSEKVHNQRIRTTSFTSSARVQSQPRWAHKHDRQSQSAKPIDSIGPQAATAAPSASSSHSQLDKQIDYRQDAGSSAADYTLPLLIASTRGASSSSTAGSSRQRQRARPAPAASATRASPTLSQSAREPDERLSPRQAGGDTIGPAASQQVASGRLLDEQPATLAIESGRSGVREAPAAANESGSQSGGRSQSAARAESRLSSVLAKRPSEGVHNGTTVELVVDSSPETALRSVKPNGNDGVGAENDELSSNPSASAAPTETTTSAAAPATTTTTATATATAAATTTTTTANTRAPADNHAALYAGDAGLSLFADQRHSGRGSALLEADFGRISESLQTNPMDLIDLQNSRSTFELPSQLESLSMLSSHQSSVSSALPVPQSSQDSDYLARRRHRPNIEKH